MHGVSVMPKGTGPVNQQLHQIQVAVPRSPVERGPAMDVHQMDVGAALQE